MAIFLPLLIKSLPAVISWVMYGLGAVYPELFPQVDAVVAGAVTAANLVPSPLAKR